MDTTQSLEKYYSLQPEELISHFEQWARAYAGNGKNITIEELGGAVYHISGRVTKRNFEEGHYRAYLWADRVEDGPYNEITITSIEAYQSRAQSQCFIIQPADFADIRDSLLEYLKEYECEPDETPPAAPAESRVTPSINPEILEAINRDVALRELDRQQIITEVLWGTRQLLDGYRIGNGSPTAMLTAPINEPWCKSRPKKQERDETIWKMREAQHTWEDIAENAGCSVNTAKKIYRKLREISEESIIGNKLTEN